MFIMLIWAAVKPEHADDFLVASLEMGHAALKEEGARRFEVLRDDTDPTRFVLYQATKTRAEHEQHLVTPHAVLWREKTKPMLAEPIRNDSYNQLF